ncbi:6-carboxytetrahydropterin synthase (plasmid) [Streptomyces sp. NBC_00445]|uniref:6-carboxytetrahydropterin synthase n=1 Tax=Streptomyces sp. NBC_00445 TaxID=2975745 RepID=UPI002E1DC4B0
MNGTLTLEHNAEFTARHAERLLPSWHPCTIPGHAHEWTATLVVSGKYPFTEAESAAVHTAFAQFDAWVAMRLNHQDLNTVDDSLAERCGVDRVAEWIYSQWMDRLPFLEAIKLSGPVARKDDDEGRRYWRPEFTYRPETQTAA